MQRGKRLAPDLPSNLRPSVRPRHSGLPTDTPMESGSASASNSRSVSPETPQTSRLRHLQSNGTSEHSATSENVLQEDIHARLKEELNGAVLHDPNFSNMMPLTDAEFKHISHHCRLYDSATTSWLATPGSSQEQKFYAPTVELLNAIGEVAHLMNPNPLPYVHCKEGPHRPVGKRRFACVWTRPTGQDARVLHASYPRFLRR